MIVALPPDATRTKRRIFEAARAEFAQYGLAGARVDRIAETASANKRSIYVHFGTKEELFDLVLAQNLQTILDTAPLEAANLPETAAAMFDLLCEQPDLLRLTQWALLERPKPYSEEIAAYRDKVEEVRAAQRAGDVSARLDAPVLLAMIIAIACSWGNAPWALRAVATSTDPAAVPDGVREGVIAAVAALTDPARG